MKGLNQQQRLPVIDLLRGLAAFLVCYYHLTCYTTADGAYLSDDNPLKWVGSFGWLGVQVFFVISGFVIPYSLHQHQYSFSQALVFLKKRWVRIEPPYLAAIAMILVLSQLWSKPLPINWNQVMSHLIYLTPFLGYEWLNEIFWTLGIEFQFYLVMAILFAGFSHQRLLPKIAAVVLFILPTFFYLDHKIVWSYASLFMMGISVFWYKTNLIKIAHFYLLLGVFTLLAVYQFPEHRVSIPLVGLLTALSILYLQFETKWGRFLGKISYSLYLTHGLIGGNFLFFSMYASFVKSNEVTKTGMVWIGILLSIGFAWIFYLLVEKPSHDLAKKIKR